MIDRALALLASDDGEAALEALVDHWRTWPAPALAAVIEALAAKLATKVPPVTGAGTTSDRQAFAQLAAEQRSATLPRLFEALPKTNGVIARERIFALAAFPRNPLISAGLVRCLEQPPFDGKARARCFPPALDVIGKHRDPRAVAVLQKLAHEEHRSATIRALGLSAWKPIVALAKEARDWPAPRPATKAETEALAAIAKKVGEPAAPPRAGVKAEALFAAVYADPADDGARLVLADFLQEAGDPRGELIAIQMARASAGGPVSKRERQLLGQWGRDWLGSIEPLVMREGVVFDRGFPAHVAYNGVVASGHHAHSQWSTVTHLAFSHLARTSQGSRAILLGRAVPALRHVIDASQYDLIAIGEAARDLPWESLTFALWSLDAVGIALLGSARLPALRRLGVFAASPDALHGATPDDLADLLDTPLGKGLRHFEAAARPAHFGDLVDLCAARRLASFTLRPTSQELALICDLAARGLIIHLDPVRASSLERVEAAIRSVRAGTIDRAVLRLKQPKKAAELDLAGIRQALRGAPLAVA